MFNAVYAALVGSDGWFESDMSLILFVVMMYLAFVVVDQVLKRARRRVSQQVERFAASTSRADFQEGHA